MKKLLASLLLFSLLILPVNSLFAANSEIPFFEALGNMANIEDYKLIQSFYGNAEFEEYEDHVSVDYRITVNSVADGGNRIDSFNRISAYMKFINHNEVTDKTPFKEMTVQANGEFISKNQRDLYFKLNNFNVSMTEALPNAIVDVENMMAMVDLYRGTWYHTSVEELAAGEFEEGIDIEEYVELEEKFKEEPKEALIDAFKLGMESSGEILSEEEINNFIKAITTVLEAKLFTKRDVVSGRNAGFKFFNVNKGGIMELLEEIASIFGEEISISDKAIIRTGLGKFSLSGIYRIENIHNLIDVMLVRFKLKNVGPLLNLELNYRYKVSDLEKENSVKAPTNYEEWVSPYENLFEDSYFDEEEWLEDEALWEDEWQPEVIE